MHSKALGQRKNLWKVLKTPTVEVVAAIVVVLGAAWIVVETEMEMRSTVFPVPFAHR